MRILIAILLFVGLASAETGVTHKISCGFLLYSPALDFSPEIQKHVRSTKFLDGVRCHDIFKIERYSLHEFRVQLKKLNRKDAISIQEFISIFSKDETICTGGLFFVDSSGKLGVCDQFFDRTFVSTKDVKIPLKQEYRMLLHMPPP